MRRYQLALIPPLAPAYKGYAEFPQPGYVHRHIVRRLGKNVATSGNYRTELSPVKVNPLKPTCLTSTSGHVTGVNARSPERLVCWPRDNRIKRHKPEKAHSDHGFRWGPEVALDKKQFRNKGECRQGSARSIPCRGVTLTGGSGVAERIFDMNRAKSLTTGGE